MADTYYIVDCDNPDCVLCPQAFRGEREQYAIETARVHPGRGEVDVIDVVMEG